MTQTAVEYKTDELSQGGAILALLLTLSEYVSRPARWKLITAVYQSLDFTIQEKKRIRRKNGDRVGRKHPCGELSRLLEVHPRTVWRWVTGGIQACNVNAGKMIRLAFEYCPEKTVVILFEDLKKHQYCYEKVIEELSQGGAMLHAIYHGPSRTAGASGSLGVSPSGDSGRVFDNPFEPPPLDKEAPA